MIRQGAIVLVAVFSLCLGAANALAQPLAPMRSTLSLGASCASPVSWQRASTTIGRVAAIKGPVVDTRFASSSSGSPTFLNVGRPYPDAKRFTVVIWIEDRVKFGPSPERRFKGKTLCVKGVVSSYYGVPEIVARSASQIQVAGVRRIAVASERALQSSGDFVVARQSSLSSVDRPADTWLTTRTAAQNDLSGRFKNIASVGCAPDRSSPTQLIGGNRWWQRFWCSGRTFDHLSFKLQYWATGQCAECWTIHKLSGIGVARLRTKASAPQPSNNGTATTSCGSGYYRNSYGHCVPRPSTDPNLAPGGPTAQCADGTYSYSEHASGTCSHHGGVASWIHHP